MSADHDLLGVSDTADLAAIKRAYRQKALSLHPDRNPSPEAHELFIRVTEAYERLTEPPVFVINYEYNAAADRARAYARMRYEEFIRESSAMDRLSIHKIFWGKEVTMLLLILSAAAMMDAVMPLRYESASVEQVLVKATRHTYKKMIRISGENFSVTVAPDQLPLDFNEQHVMVSVTPLLHIVRSYRSASEHYKSEHKLETPLDEYMILPWLVFALSLVVFVVKFNTFYNKLAVKMILLILSLSYLLAYLVGSG